MTAVLLFCALWLAALLADRRIDVAGGRLAAVAREVESDCAVVADRP